MHSGFAFKELCFSCWTLLYFSFHWCFCLFVSFAHSSSQQDCFIQGIIIRFIQKLVYLLLNLLFTLIFVCRLTFGYHLVFWFSFNMCYYWYICVLIILLDIIFCGRFCFVEFLLEISTKFIHTWLFLCSLRYYLFAFWLL